MFLEGSQTSIKKETITSLTERTRKEENPERNSKNELYTNKKGLEYSRPFFMIDILCSRCVLPHHKLRLRLP